MALFALAIINVLTKKVATISGVSFTIVFFIVFELSDIYNRKRQKAAHAEEHGEVPPGYAAPTSPPKAVNVRPGNVLVAVRNPNRLQHLARILEKTDTRRMDIVVLSMRQVTQAGSGEHRLEVGQIFSDDETKVFTRVVTLAEKAGKHVELMVVPGTDPYEAAVQTAARLQSSRIVMGLSPSSRPPSRARRWAATGSSCPSRGPRSRSKSCWRTRGTRVLQPGPASAAALAGGHRPGAPPLAGAERHGTRRRSCTTAT